MIEILKLLLGRDDCPQLSESANSKSADSDKNAANLNSFLINGRTAMMNGFEEETCNCT